MTQYLFYFLSFLAVMCALLVVTSKNPVHSVLYLVLVFFALAGHYIVLNAQFLAAVHIIVYAGAIMVLFLYVIMMMNLNNAESEPQKSNIMKLAAVVTAGLLIVVMVGALKDAGAVQIAEEAKRTDVGLIKNLGKVLFKEYLLPFEVSAVLFLSAMVGAVMIGKNENK
jgi:NADH-quinone oxidoreductase subunit J